MAINERPIHLLFEVHHLSDAEKQARAQVMYELYSDRDNPRSLAEVGQMFEGMSRQRVQQILRDYGYPVRAIDGTVKLKRSANERE